MNLSSDSAGATVFATTLAGPSVISIVIPSGEPNVAVFYGDTAPDSPILAASGALASAVQNETILVIADSTDDAALASGP